jgi:preprotein translocase subunit SecA
LNQQRLKVYARRREILKGNPEEVEVVLQSILSKATEEQKNNVLQNRKRMEEITQDSLAFLKTARGVMLQTIDVYWIDHLEFMD